mgnify:CR=1 FL=1
MGKFAEIWSEADYQAALSLCKGSYQRDIINGNEALSGSTLRGKASRYSDRYKQSSANLLARCRKAGIDICVQVREPGHKHVLVIGI